MAYSIEFQTAGLVIVSTLIIIFFSKPRWHSIQNSVFRLLLIITFFELLFDIISVITITERDSIPSIVNNFFSESYIVIMILWITVCVIYIITNTIYSGITPKALLRKKILSWFIIVPALCCMSTVFIFPLKYAGTGRSIYSYGIPSTGTYIFSVYCVILSIICFFVNFRHMTFERKVPTITFTLMEGFTAMLQMRFPNLLVIGFGTAVCVFIMYMTMENPDMDMIAKLDAANKKSTDLLLNILPASVAMSLQKINRPVTQSHADVTVAFMDIVDFTKLSSRIGPEKLVNILNSLFSEIDIMLEDYKIEKIKTIGDAYMVAAGLPEEYPDNCREMMKFAIDVMQYIKTFNAANNIKLQIRIGINSGPVVAGVIGKKKFIYDLWGSTVNFASRMESNGVPGRIQVSESVYKKLADSYTFEKREHIEIKGFGDCCGYLLS